MVMLADYIMEKIVNEGVKHVFMVSGGGAMYLIDALGRNKKLQFICNHHEQAAAMSAEGYQRVTGNLGVALVTTGPAATNALTSLLCAWNDSIPVLYISGQAKSTSLIGDTGLRQRGVHEVNIIKMVESVTKYSVLIRDEKKIRYYLEKAIYMARNGRPGPVWLDIPLDIQSKPIDPASLVGFDPKKDGISEEMKEINSEIIQIKDLLIKSTRPIIIAGHGIRLAGCQKQFLDFIEKYGIPVVTTKNGMDLIYDDHPLLAGRMGINGQRAGNFAVQNSDLVIALGTRLPNPVVGYETHLFAREAKKVVVDIDQNQLKHCFIKVDIPIHSNVKNFLGLLDQELINARKSDFSKWIDQCHHWRQKYPPVLPLWKNQTKYVNSYYFFEVLSEIMDENDILVTDQGATFYSSTVAFKLKKGQRLFTNGGFSPMGYGLPAAIGACFGNNRRKIICAHGDGGLQLNIQELQTIVHHKLPIKLFVFNNEGYLSIKHTQCNYFEGRFVGCDPKSGLSCPDIIKIAAAYGIPSKQIENHTNMSSKIAEALSIEGPVIIELILDPLQEFAPRVSSERKPDGRMVSKPLEDMYPFLDREEFKREMIIKPVDDGK